jgi:colicin import membrane protein
VKNKRTFMTYFWKVAGIHAAILIVLLIVPAVRHLFRKKPPVVLPIEFVVEVPSHSTPPVPEPRPQIPEPAPVLAPKPKPRPKPKPKPRPEIKRSTNLVTRANKRTVSKPTLSAEEIQRLLNAGAKPSDHTSDPGEDARCLDIIRRRFYAAWTQPAGYAGDGHSAEVALDLLSGGRIGGWQILRGSGSAEFDASVKSAAGSISQVNGLTEGFIKRRPKVTIAFRIE